jgi:plasmid stability protein
MSDYRAATYRLPADLAEELRVAAEVAGRSVNAELVAAVRNHLAAVKQTPAFKDGVARLLRRNDELLRRLQ